MEVKRFVWNSLAGRMLIAVFVGLILLIGYYALGSSSSSSPAIAGRDIFDEKCLSCHTIGGGALVGPDLKGVLERRDRDWVARFIASPDRVIGEGDPIALELLAEYNGVAMPNLALSEEDVELIMAHFEVQDNLTEAAVALPVGDASHGEKLFTGARAMENRGTPCMGCHTVGSTGAYGGGNLGPDLTFVYTRYGELGLASAITNISFPTMKNVYLGKELSAQETADLLAYFAKADIAGNEGLAESTTNLFWASGVVGAFALFVFMAFSWPRQSKNLTERLRKKAAADLRRNS